MRQKSLVHAAQLPLRFDDPAELERLIERRVAERFEAEALLWRFRLIAVETVLLSSLVLAAGLATGQPFISAARIALLVGGACFAAGMLLLGLSFSTAKLFARLRSWRRQ